jgi:hypothetical protein
MQDVKSAIEGFCDIQNSLALRPKLSATKTFVKNLLQNYIKFIF